MKKGVTFGFLILAIFASMAAADDVVPVAISPGSERDVALVSGRCPTFSWSEIAWASGYRVVVFEDRTGKIQPYEAMAASSSPAVSRDIQGKALSWTPSEGEGLKDGGSYVWYVQARDASGNGLWSEGKAFRVEVEKTSIIGLEKRSARTLRERRVVGNAIPDAAGEIRAGSTAGKISKEFALERSGRFPTGIQGESGGPGVVKPQGNEGDANNNTYYGLNAGYSLDPTRAYSNAFFGFNAGYQTTIGDSNTFAGDFAGILNTTGSCNAFFGSEAGYGNLTGSGNTFIGWGAGSDIQGSSENTFVGESAAFASAAGNANTFIGRGAGYNNAGHQNLFSGWKSGYENRSGSQNVFLGGEAGRLNTAGSGGVFIGYRSGYNNAGGYNTFVGWYSGENNASGYQNAFIGCEAGRDTNTGNMNTFIGPMAGRKNTAGYQNSFLGRASGYDNTTGNENTSVGTSAGEKNQVGSQNTTVGHTAGFRNMTSYGTFVGYQAGYSNTTGANNTFLGWKSGYANATGAANVYLGRNAGYKNSKGSRNVFLGNAAGYNETGSDKLYIGNSSATFPLIYGNFDAALVAVNGKLGVGRKDPAYPLHMASGARCTTGGVWTNASSRILKENIRALAAEDAREALVHLSPVRFQYKAEKAEECLGFIAEDVPELVATTDRKGLSPMDIVAVLTKVVQEQQKEISELKEKMRKLEDRSR